MAYKFYRAPTIFFVPETIVTMLSPDTLQSLLESLRGEPFYHATLAQFVAAEVTAALTERNYVLELVPDFRRVCEIDRGLLQALGLIVSIRLRRRLNAQDVRIRNLTPQVPGGYFRQTLRNQRARINEGSPLILGHPEFANFMGENGPAQPTRCLLAASPRLRRSLH